MTWPGLRTTDLPCEWSGGVPFVSNHTYDNMIILWSYTIPCICIGWHSDTPPLVDQHLQSWPSSSLISPLPTSIQSGESCPIVILTSLSWAKSSWAQLSLDQIMLCQTQIRINSCWPSEYFIKKLDLDRFFLVKTQFNLSTNFGNTWLKMGFGIILKGFRISIESYLKGSSLKRRK